MAISRKFYALFKIANHIILGACYLTLSQAFAGTAKDVILPLFSVSYSISSLGVQLGVANRRLEKLDNGDWRLESHSKTVGVTAWIRDDQIYETSTFRLDGKKVRPLAYEYHHSGSKKQKHILMYFNWEAKQVESTVNGKKSVINIESGILDKLNYQAALMLDLQGGVKDVGYTVADGDEIKSYQVDFSGEEVLSTPAGDLKTLKFTRYSSNKKRYSAIWCAPALAYLPVKLEHKEPDGVKVVLDLEAFSGIDLQQPGSDIMNE